MNAARFRHLVNLYPPYLGAGVQVTHVSGDFREVRVKMPLRFYNRNYVGTHFGGSLYSMVDPFYMVMLIENLGSEYLVWDKSAEIEFIKPGRGSVSAHFLIDERRLDEIRRAAGAGKPVLPSWTIEICDDRNEAVARVRKTLYIKKKPRD